MRFHQPANGKIAATELRQGLRQQIGARPIVGLESCSGPEVLQNIVTATNGQVTFSLDLKGGQPMTNRETRWADTALDISRSAFACGVEEMIVLDLAEHSVTKNGQAVSALNTLTAAHAVNAWTNNAGSSISRARVNA